MLVCYVQFNACCFLMCYTDQIEIHWIDWLIENKTKISHYDPKIYYSLFLLINGSMKNINIHYLQWKMFKIFFTLRKNGSYKNCSQKGYLGHPKCVFYGFAAFLNVYEQ